MKRPGSQADQLFFDLVPRLRILVTVSSWLGQVQLCHPFTVTARRYGKEVTYDMGYPRTQEDRNL